MKKVLFNEIKQLETLQEKYSFKLLLMNESLSFIYVLCYNIESLIYDFSAISFLIQIPERYPFDAPKVYFKMPSLHHFAIHQRNGEMELDLLKSWKVGNNLFQVIQAVKQQLISPAANCFVDEALLNEYNTDLPTYTHKGNISFEKYKTAEFSVVNITSDSKSEILNLELQFKLAEATKEPNVSSASSAPQQVSEDVEIYDSIFVDMVREILRYLF